MQTETTFCCSQKLVPNLDTRGGKFSLPSPNLSLKLRLMLTLRLLMSYIYGAPSKARNANVVYIWTYVWQR